MGGSTKAAGNVYAYVDGTTKREFDRYAARVGLDSANLLRLLLLKAVSAPNFRPAALSPGPPRRVKVPARLGGPLLRKLVKALKGHPSTPGEVAASVIFAEIKERSLERFLLS